jgi:hypothetical protein
LTLSGCAVHVSWLDAYRNRCASAFRREDAEAGTQDEERGQRVRGAILLRTYVNIRYVPFSAPFGRSDLRAQVKVASERRTDDTEVG